MGRRFDSLPLPPALLAVVAELGYEQLTPIQAESIPVMLAGGDLIGQSKTGSGKTAAFALPILCGLALESRTLQALVLCPTRELAAQVAREIRKLGRRHAGLQVLVVCGGEPLRLQAAALARGVHLVVGTPGRVLDHLSRSTLALATVKVAVLDEADRMLDMGFADDMDKILRALPAARQTVFFSATFPTTIETMSRAHQRDAVRVSIDDDEVAPAEIRQQVLAVSAADKLDALCELLATTPHDAALVFCNRKVTIADVTRRLFEAGASVDCLHGDLEQFDRDRVMATFRNGSVRVLVATDVAARGIDITGLDLVVNYDLPPQEEVYVHRIGRTGRAGVPGLSITLATPGERHLRTAIEARTGCRMETLSRRRPGSADAMAPPAMDTISISGGRRDKIRPGDILGALTGEAGGLSAAQVGKIEIHERLSYVAVAREVSRNAARSLNDGQIKGKRFRATRVPRFKG